MIPVQYFLGPWPYLAAIKEVGSFAAFARKRARQIVNQRRQFASLNMSIGGTATVPPMRSEAQNGVSLGWGSTGAGAAFAVFVKFNLRMDCALTCQLVSVTLVLFLPLPTSFS